MEKILNQEEIDALFHAAQEKVSSTAAVQSARRVSPFNFNQAGRISKNQVRAVSLLHDTFARSLTNSLGAFLRVGIEANLVSVEQLSFAEFLQRLPDSSYLASVAYMPFDVKGALQVDLSLGFPIIDLLLGGRGTPETQVRDMTEIEAQVIESIVKLVLKELEATWRQSLDVEFIFEQRQQETQILQLMSPNEKTLSLIFEIRMPAARGLLNLVFPTVVSNALLRKLSQLWSYRLRRTSPDGAERLRELLLHCPFPVELKLPASPVRIADLLELEEDHVLPLEYGIQEPAVLSVSGKEMFSAYPVRCRNTRGGQLERRLKISSLLQRENE